MNGINVELLEVMGCDLSTVNAARVSFNKQKTTLDGDDVKLIKYLAEHRHMTPFRHNAIKIRCKAPIFLVRQLGKHQAGLSWNEVSRRYVDDEPEFYIPDVWRARPEGSVKQGSGKAHHANKHAISLYAKHVRESELLYFGMIDGGIAPEMARMILPQSMLSEWIWTGNLLAFSHVYKERINPGAQLEAQDFAKQLDGVIRPAFPESWSALVD